MPLCPRCRKPFACKCGEEPQEKLGALAEECPEKKTAAVWVHVVDDRGIDIPGVATMKGGDGGPTDRDGTAVFESVEPGTHNILLSTFSDDLLKLYEKPTLTTRRTVTVLPGQIAYVPYQLSRKALLRVLVIQNAPRTPFGGAAVTVVDGPEQPSGHTVKETGLAELGRVPAGSYEISVTLADTDVGGFATTVDFADTPEKIKLLTGEEREVVVVVEAKNVVTSQVAMAKTLLVIDHWPGNREAPTECVELSLKQTNTAHRYSKGIAFKCASATDVEAFLDEACSESKKLGRTLNSGVALPEPEQNDLRNGKTVNVYLRGNSQAGPLAISLELADPADRFVTLGKQPPPVDAEIQLLARPHVNIKWAGGGGVDGVKVALDGVGGKHAIPDPSAGGLAKWANRGIKTGLYNFALTFPDNIQYLLFDTEDNAVTNPSFDFKPMSESVTYQIKKAKVNLAFTCDGETATVNAKVKVKSADEVTLTKGSAAKLVEIPVTEVDQKCVIETFTLDGGNVYEYDDVDAVPI